jgi:hypothetical protein
MRAHRSRAPDVDTCPTDQRGNFCSLFVCIEKENRFSSDLACFFSFGGVYFVR